METGALAWLWKGDPRKVLVAATVRQNTSLSDCRLADRLSMGHAAWVSRLLAQCRKDKENMRNLAKLEGMLR